MNPQSLDSDEVEGPGGGGASDIRQGDNGEGSLVVVAGGRAYPEPFPAARGERQAVVPVSTASTVRTGAQVLVGRS